ncbi:MAG: hypothetical protein Q9201_001203 [Fulgogasparrea decipioides]
MAQPIPKLVAEHGTHIFVYNNIRTNQVIYSLTRTLNNNSSLKQLPFLGKKTVPARLRKDLWHPLCHISFPHPSQGLLAYRRLREFRRLRETAYPRRLITRNNSRNGPLLPKKKRGKMLMDQKANSIADIARILYLQKKGLTNEQVKNAKMRKERVERLKAKGKKSMRRRDPQKPQSGGVKGVVIRWANLLDAEFAKSWPEKVVHDGLTAHRYTAAFPPLEEPDPLAEGESPEVEKSLKGEQGVGAGRKLQAGGRDTRTKTEIPAALLEQKSDPGPRNRSWIKRLFFGNS